MIKIGHRGACGYEPENTLSSFKKAIELSVDMIEFDVHKALTGELVVIHDENLERTTNGTGFVKDKSLEYLKTLNIKDNEKIPTLDEVVDLILTSNKNIIINIEIKAKNIILDVIERIKYYITNYSVSYDNFIISSFDYNQLITSKTTCPDIKRGLLIHLPFNNSSAITKLTNLFIIKLFINKLIMKTSPYFIGLEHSFLMSLNKTYIDIVEIMRQKNILILVYTVNKVEDIVPLKTLNINGIFSDYPDILSKL